MKGLVGVRVVADTRGAEALERFDGTSSAAFTRADQSIAALAVKIPFPTAALTRTLGLIKLNNYLLIMIIHRNDLVGILYLSASH